MKKLMLAALLLYLAPMTYAASQGPTLPVLQDQSGQNQPTVYAQTLEFVGCVPFQVEQSTAPKLIFAGSGNLYELNSSSGSSANSYSMAFDTNAVYDVNGGSSTGLDYGLGLLVSGAAINKLPKGVAISPRVWVDNAATAAPTVSGQGRWVPAKPRRVLNGLVVSNSDTVMDAAGCYRTDAMNAANPVVK